jgi:hypothetical protein
MAPEFRFIYFWSEGGKGWYKSRGYRGEKIPHLLGMDHVIPAE